MGVLYKCGVCCMVLSIWAVIQLVIMGIFFKMEVFAFIEEAEAPHGTFDDYDDFMRKTHENYKLIAINCWIAAAIYLLFIGISWFCIKKAKAKDRLAAMELRDDEKFCIEKSKKLT